MFKDMPYIVSIQFYYSPYMLHAYNNKLYNLQSGFVNNFKSSYCYVTKIYIYLGTIMRIVYLCIYD